MCLTDDWARSTSVDMGTRKYGNTEIWIYQSAACLVCVYTKLNRIVCFAASICIELDDPFDLYWAQKLQSHSCMGLRKYGNAGMQKYGNRLEASTSDLLTTLYPTCHSMFTLDSHFGPHRARNTLRQGEGNTEIWKYDNTTIRRYRNLQRFFVGRLCVNRSVFLRRQSLSREHYCNRGM